MTDYDPTRRAILKRGLMLAASRLGIGIATAAAASDTAHWAHAGKRVFAHADSAATMGRCCLREEPKVQILLEAVFRRLTEQSTFVPTRSDEEVILHGIEADYRFSRVLDIGGWSLSETEVAFFILAAGVRP